jgi:hypothetical protein
MLEDVQRPVDAAPTAAPGPVPHPQAKDAARERWEMVRETIALILLSVTAIFTAWCGFEAAKWGGEMSIAFSRASAARVEAAKQHGIANNARLQDLTIYGLYLQAEVDGNEKFARYIEHRFSDPFQAAFDVWNASGRTSNSPFALPEYVEPGTAEAEAADQRADKLFAQALVNNRRGDNYTLLTVLAALVLFFAAVSGRLPRPSLRWAGLTFAGLLFLIAGGLVLTFPVVI